MTHTHHLLQIRRDLINTRTKYGAKTPIGHRCSNAVETINALLDQPVEDHPILLQSLTAQLLEIEQLRNGVPARCVQARYPQRATKVDRLAA